MPLLKTKRQNKIQQAWQAYLEACRDARVTAGIDPVTVEQWAWARLQDELTLINTTR